MVTLLKDAEGKPRQFYIIKTRKYGKKEIPTYEAKNGEVKLDVDTLTDDEAVAKEFRLRGHQVRHFGTLTVEDALKYSGKEIIQVFGKDEGMITPDTKFNGD